MAVEAYPLTWPAGWERTPSYRRETGAFKMPLGRARDGLLAEIGRMGGRRIVMSSNMQLRRDGLPYAQQGAIDDKGIAVYFERKGKPMCFACDRYTSLEANMRAIELTIAALRGITRWGASDMLERAFTGFTALPGAGGSEHWSDVLGLAATAGRDEIESAYRRLRSQHHPDRGGDAEQFHRITKAYEEATS